MHLKYISMENKEIQVFAEQYFSSQNYLNKKILQDISSVRDSIPIEKWEKLTFTDREKVIDENILRTDIQSKYSGKNFETKTSFLSFPKLKQRTGQKFVVEENNSADGKPFSYRDEHSSPFGWKTRSQQNLNFDIYGTKGQLNEEAISDNSMDVVTARRSTILSCPFGQYAGIRQTKVLGKPVRIPTVPAVSGGDKSVCTDIAEVTSLVSSVVIESDNNIVLDFSTNIEDRELGSENNEEDLSAIPATARSGASSTSLLSKKCKTPTLKRKKSLTSTDTLLTTVTDDDAETAPGLQSHSPARLSVSKPSCAPPPPPGVARPTAAPPPPPAPRSSAPAPPVRGPLTRISGTGHSEVTSTVIEKEEFSTGELAASDQANKTKEECSNMKITGFDFLDNW